MGKKQQDKALIGSKTKHSEIVPNQPALRCVCGHLEEEHEPSDDVFVDRRTHFCRVCTKFGAKFPTQWHDFKLDNLSLIEDMAHKKGLI